MTHRTGRYSGARWALLVIVVGVLLAMSACVPETPTPGPTATATPTGTMARPATDTQAPATATLAPTQTEAPSQTPTQTETLPPTGTPTLTATLLTPSPTPLPTVLPDGPVAIDGENGLRALVMPELWQVRQRITLNVRAGPGTGYPVIGKLTGGEYVAAWATGGGWTTLITMRTTDGHVSTQYLERVDCKNTVIQGQLGAQTGTLLNITSWPEGQYQLTVIGSAGRFVAEIGESGVFRATLLDEWGERVVAGPVDFELDCRHPIAVLEATGQIGGGEAGGNPMQLFSLSDTGAVCNDGTRAGYYYRAGGPVWVIHLQGGGMCWDATSCGQRAQSQPQFMTSRAWPATRQGDGLQSADPAVNPDFYAATHVYVPYCSSDLWSGAGDGLGYVFRGQTILQAVMRSLAGRGLSTATGVILSGSSAGGSGVMNNLDRLAGTLRQPVLGINDAGWFVVMGAYGGTQSSPAEQMQQAVALWRGQPDASCAAALAPAVWRCYFGQYAYPFVTTPMGVQISQADPVQLGSLGLARPFDAGELAYSLSFAAAVRASLEPVALAFSPARPGHGLLMTQTGWLSAIDGATFAQVVGDWFLGRQGPVKLIGK